MKVQDRPSPSRISALSLTAQVKEGYRGDETGRAGRCGRLLPWVAAERAIRAASIAARIPTATKAPAAKPAAACFPVPDESPTFLVRLSCTTAVGSAARS